MKSPLPAPQIVVSFAKIGRQHSQSKQHMIDDIDREAERFFEVNEQDHARLFGFVPGFVLIGVIKDKNAALFPAAYFGADSNSQIGIVFGYQ